MSVICHGAPARVSVCHCSACRKRTGSAFGIAVFFPRAQVEVDGVGATFERMGDSGNSIAFHFCSLCGSTLWWEPQAKPDLIAVAHGAFDDPRAFRPEQSVYEDERQDWIMLADDIAKRS